jgi:hypothetical protein
MMAWLPTRVASALLVLRKDVLTKHLEVRFMRRKGKHDQISVEAIDDVLGVGIVRVVRTLTTDEVHDFVLSFAWNGCI